MKPKLFPENNLFKRAKPFLENKVPQKNKNKTRIFLGNKASSKKQGPFV